VTAARGAGGSARRGLAVALVGLLAAALVLWLAAGSVWLHVPAGDAGDAGDPTGADLVALVGAAAPISLAAIGGLVASRGAGRRVVGGVVALAGVAVLAGALDVVLRPERAAARWAGPAGSPGALAVEPTGWAWAGVLAGALLVAVGGAAVARAAAWPAMSARYERAPAGPRSAPVSGPAGTAGGQGEPASMRDAWDAQDRGDDPTAG
jgi:uncharacterized membrane protein (TIGR02234 family)